MEKKRLSVTLPVGAVLDLKQKALIANMTVGEYMILNLNLKKDGPEK